MSAFERWLWTRHRLRLSWKGEVARDVVVLAAVITGAYAAWVLLTAVAT